MKSKLFNLLAALMVVFTMSSCLGESETINYPTYERMVTVGPGAIQLYSDNGEILRPMNTVAGLEKVSRAIVAFNLIPAELNGSNLEAGKIYDVELNANYCYNVPTRSIIDLNENQVALDSLVNTQQPITNVDKMYAKKGFITAEITYRANQFAPYYMDVALDSEADVDLDTKTITFTLYYDYKQSATNVTIKYPFSFRLPSGLYEKFAGESKINVVFRYKAEDSTYREVTSTMSSEDFFLPSF